MANNTYTVDYAPTAKAGCKYSQCKTKIEKGSLRIGKSYPSDRFTDGGSGNEYFHPKCWFEAQKKVKKTTKKVESEDDLQGFDVISAEHQSEILDLIKHRNDPPLHSPKKKAKKTDGAGGGGGGGGTPKKKPTKQVYIDSDEETNNKTKPNNTGSASKNKNKKTISESDGEESEDLEKDAWAAVASNGSKVAKVLNSTDISQVTVIILASASNDAIIRASGQDESSFEQEFAEPNAYLHWLAGNGVLWISTDFDDAGYTSPGLWGDTSTAILRQIFMQKPKKGLIVALWGPETKRFKLEIKQLYNDTMGTVKYRAIDGTSPLSSAFNSADALSKIDDARTLLSMHALHWWPFEGEVAQKKSAAEKKKGGNEGGAWVLDSSEEGVGTVELTAGSPMELGRSLVNNKKVSRKQCVVEVGDDGVELTSVGVNPMTMSKAGTDDVEILSKNEKYTLQEGDSFTLCGEQYRFVVRRVAQSQAAKSKPTKQPSKIIAGESEGEKTKLDSGDAEGETEKKDKEEGEKEDQEEEGGKKSTKNDATPVKKSSQGESESATVPFSAGYDSPEEAKPKPKKKEKPDVKMDDAEGDVDDEEVARKLQEELNKEEEAKPKTPKSKNNTPDKDAALAKKLQEKFNKESGGKNKRKQDEDDDDGEVNWTAKVKKQKKSKKGSDDDDDWSASVSVADEDSDGDYVEEDSDDDKGKKKKGASPKKPPCMYGSKCYRKNAEHFKEFSHPK